MRKSSAQARPKAPVVSLAQRLRRGLQYGMRFGLLAALCASVGYGVWWLRQPSHLPLRAVQVEGEFRRLSSEQLQAAVAGSVQGGFFTVDVEAVRRAAQALPWVESVSVRRVWPDGLQLQVVEQRAAARWGERGLLNMRGELFMPAVASVPQHLPQLRGPDELRRRVMEHYIAMTAALAPLGRRVAELQLDERRAWQLRLDNGIDLQLGREHSLPRLQRFVRVYPALLAAREAELKAVDLRYSNGFAVRWDRSSEAVGQQQEG